MQNFPNLTKPFLDPIFDVEPRAPGADPTRGIEPGHGEDDLSAALTSPRPEATPPAGGTRDDPTRSEADSAAAFGVLTFGGHRRPRLVVWLR